MATLTIGTSSALISYVASDYLLLDNWSNDDIQGWVVASTLATVNEDPVLASGLISTLNSSNLAIVSDENRTINYDEVAYSELSTEFSATGVGPGYTAIAKTNSVSEDPVSAEEVLPMSIAKAGGGKGGSGSNRTQYWQ